MARRTLHLACLAAIVLPLTAQAAVVQDGIVVFGDSLSDTGNVAAATGGLIPGDHYYNGRFSNGPVWVEHLAAGLGMQAPAPWLAGGSNYAFGGSLTGDETPTNPPEDLPDIPSMNDQVDAYLTRRPPTRKPRFDLFVLWGGANDLLFNLPSGPNDPLPNPSAPAANIKQHIADLHDAGARKFLVPNLPDLGEVPLLNQTPLSSLANDLAAAFNAHLDAALDELEQERSNIKILRMDVDGFIDGVLANPDAYGLKNVENPLAEGLYPPPGEDWDGEVMGDPDKYLFWDSVHLSAAGHELLGDFALETLGEAPGFFPPGHRRQARGRAAGFTTVSAPEPTTLGLLLFGSMAAATLRRRPRRPEA